LPAALSLALGLLTVFVLFVTTRDVYPKHCYKISAVVSLLICSLSLLATANVGGRFAFASPSSPSIYSHAYPGDISPAALYAVYLAITLLVSKVRLYILP
jgi:hypothetical protein